MIHVFKTSVESFEDIEVLSSPLENLSIGLQWNFDLEDCDNILRIDSSTVSPEEIIDVLLESNFECQELE